MPDPRLEVLITRDKVAARVQELGAEINEHLDGPADDILLVALLRGAVFFFVDLVRAMGSPNVRFELVRASSYADNHSEGEATTSTGKVELDEKALEACAGRRVVLIDDIVDTGLTLKTLHDVMLARGAKDVISAVLLDKKERREVDYNAQFVGFEIPNHFVVGYGLDCAGEYRTLADICIFHPEG